MRRKLSGAVHDCRGEIFRDSSKELFNDKIYTAEEIGKYIDPDVTDIWKQVRSDTLENAEKAMNISEGKFHIIRPYFAWSECWKTF